MEVVVEQSPVEGVHPRSGGHMPGQYRGDHRWHVIRYPASSALSYVLDEGEWTTTRRYLHAADIGYQPVDQSQGGVAGVMPDVLFSDSTVSG